MIDMTGNDVHVGHIIITDLTVMRHVLQMASRSHCRNPLERGNAKLFVSSRLQL